MSHAGNILGISELEVERVDRNDHIEVYARPTRRPVCIHCAHDDVKIKATNQRTLKHTRQGNQLMTLHLRAPKYYCPKCQRYFCHRFNGVRPRYRASEAFKLEVFEAHDGGVSQRKIAKTHRTSEATVERWYQGFCRQRRSEMANRPCPQVLGIDEHFFTRKRGYAKQTTTKTDGSTRDIQMSQPVFNALKQQSKVTCDIDYVFANKAGNPLSVHNVTKRIWYPLLRCLGLSLRRPYQTRHTAATLWLAAGENPEWIARKMGHSTTEMLFRIYSRYVPNLTRQDGSAFESLLNRTLNK